MRTDELITLLATGVPAVDKHLFGKRFALALVVSVLGAALLMTLLFGVRPDLAQVARLPLFYAKLALPVALLPGALYLTRRTACQGGRVGGAWVMLCIPLLVLWLASAYTLLEAPLAARLPLTLGRTWKGCPFKILLLSLPGIVAFSWALRGLAPTRLPLAGAGAGALAGTLATLVYCLHCPEMTVPFWGVWYVLGMALPTALGALLGRCVLRW